MDWMERLNVLKLAPLEGSDFSPLTEEDIQDIEGAAGARLPADYRVFLSRFGPSLFETDVVFPTDGGGCVPGWFLGTEIKKLIEDFGERYPQRVVPINDDGGGNMIVISLREDSYGTIYYQSHSAGTGELREDPIEHDTDLLSTLFRLAPDFASFIGGLELDTNT